MNSNLSTNLKDIVGHTLWMEQLKAIVMTMVLAIVGTVILTLLSRFWLVCVPCTEEEILGLDLPDHGEVGYHYEEA